MEIISFKENSEMRLKNHMDIKLFWSIFVLGLQIIMLIDLVKIVQDLSIGLLILDYK